MPGGMDAVGGSAGTDNSVAIQGRITVSNSGEMRTTLATALHAKPANLSVDLSGVAYLDTSGLATLIEAARIARGQGTRMILRGIHDQPRYFLEISHLDRLFDIAAQEAAT
jgi:anti-anti-sigma factor